jgi:hypothetical protein
LVVADAICTKSLSVKSTTGASSQLYILLEIKMKNLQVPPITYEMARSLVKVMKVRNANDVAKALIEQEFKKRGL